VTPQLRVTAAQVTPAFLDREATIDTVVELVKGAAGTTDLMVFPESFVPGYPDWVWRTNPWTDGAWYERLSANAVEIPGEAIARVGEAAREAAMWIALGVTERVGSGTLYNSVVYIDPHGEVGGLHRKLVPTGAERLIWGNGQDSLLTVLDIGGFRVGSLICWENYLPLARAALYEAGIDVLLAPTWDNSDEWISTLVHIAKEGQIFVVGVTPFLRGSDVPRDIEGAAEIYGGDDDWMSKGNTTIVAPGGKILNGPLIGESGLVHATLDSKRITIGRRLFDPVGHYARPDVLELVVKKPIDPDLSL
jgi:nitrilase